MYRGNFEHKNSFQSLYKNLTYDFLKQSKSSNRNIKIGQNDILEVRLRQIYQWLSR
jgi:hypothetical protein